jgi:hypothetical protein
MLHSQGRRSYLFAPRARGLAFFAAEARGKREADRGNRKQLLIATAARTLCTVDSDLTSNRAVYIV